MNKKNSIVRFSPQTMQWYNESKGRFLDNNILTFGSAWYLVMVQIQFSLI